MLAILYSLVVMAAAVISYLLSRNRELKVTIEAYENDCLHRLNGIKLIEIERWRQITEEGWTMEHDDREHANGELAMAAVCYALEENGKPYLVNVRKNLWPWAKSWWKPNCNGDRTRNLVKAGALIAAELDRLQRKSSKDQDPSSKETSSSNLLPDGFNAKAQSCKGAKGNHENCNVPSLHPSFCQCATESGKEVV